MAYATLKTATIAIATAVGLWAGTAQAGDLSQKEAAIGIIQQGLIEGDVGFINKSIIFSFVVVA